MTNNHHTVIATGAAANASVFNSPLSQLDTSITTNATNIAATTAEVIAARAAYPNLGARLDDLILSGGNVATKANGASVAGQKVLTVDATDGFIVGAYVTYLLNGTTLEGNTIASIQAGVSLTLGTNIGATPAGGVLDDTYISMISISEYLAAQAIPHAGTLMLPQTVEYVNDRIFHVEARGAKGDYTTDDTAAINATVAAAKAGGGIHYKVKLAAGAYRITDTLNLINAVGMTFEGSEEGTIIYVDSATCVALDLTGAVQVQIRNLEIRPAIGVNRTAGSFFKLWGASRITLENLLIRTPWDGIDIRPLAGNLSGTPAYSSQINIQNVRFDYSDETGWGTAVNIFGASSISMINVSAVFGGKTVTSGTVFEINSNVDTVTMWNCSAGSNDTDNVVALRIKNDIAGSTFAPRLLSFSDCYFESGFDATTAGYGVVIAAGFHIVFTNLYCASCNIGVAITGGDNIQIIGGTQLRHKEYGIIVTGGTNILLNGQTFTWMSQKTTLTYDGIRVEGAVAGLVIEGNIFDPDGGGSADLLNAIYIGGAVTNYSVFGNITYGKPIVDNTMAATGMVAGDQPGYTQVTITDPANTTPSAGGFRRALYFTQTSASNVNTFDDGREGQILTCVFNNGNTTLKNADTTGGVTVVLRLAGAADFNPGALDVVTFLRLSNSWYEISRSVN